jgi:hypothetical protein
MGINNHQMMECLGCGQHIPSVFVDLEPSLFGERAHCINCGEVCEFEVVRLETNPDD